MQIDPNERPARLVERELFADWSPGVYDLKVSMAGSPADTQNPIKEPAFDQYPIRDLQATASTILLNLGPEMPEVPATEEPAEPDAPTRPRPPTIPDNPLIAAAQDDLERFERRTGTGAGPGSAIEGMPADMGAPITYQYEEISYFDDYSSGGGMSLAGQQLRGRGQPFVAVRGIIPLHELIRAVQKARRTDFASAAARFQLLDYVLERQTSRPDGTFPPADQDDQWEPIDRTTAEAILEEVAFYDADPVPPALTDFAVTMPLPARITGLWGKLASHPSLEKFQLTEEQMEAEMKYQRALIEKAQEAQARRPAQEEEVQVGGFSRFVGDSRQMARDVLGSESYYATDYENAMLESGSGSMYGEVYGSLSTGRTDKEFDKLVEELASVVDSSKKDKALREYIKKRVTTAGNLLLFRFLDFAVEPGKSYRYRARVVLKNPNYNERISNVETASVAQGTTRLNAWSNVTAPAYVPPDSYYFIAKMDSSHKRALLDFFHYDPELGTIVSNLEPDPPEEETRANNRFERLEVGFGETIGGRLKVWELDPARLTFAKDEIDGTRPNANPPRPTPIGYGFYTGDLLVTALEDITLDRTQHPDLDLPQTQNRDLQLVAAMLVSEKGGTLKRVDTISQKIYLEYQLYLLEEQNKPFRELKLTDDPLAAGGEYNPDCPYGSEYEAAMSMEMEGGRNNRRTGNLLKRGSRSRGSAPASRP